MKVNGLVLTKPKSKNKALNQAAYCLNQIKVREEKEDKLMKLKSQIEEKLDRLQKQLQQIETTISEVSSGKTGWNQSLEQLKLEWQLTDAEILETRSELLRRQIVDLNKKAGVQDFTAGDSYLPEG